MIQSRQRIRMMNNKCPFKIKTVVVAKGGKSIELDPEQIERKKKKSGW